MSRPRPRKPSVARVQPREQKSSSRAPSTIPEFMTQLKQDELEDLIESSEDVVLDTQNRSSGRRHRMKSQNVQVISSTSASPSQHSVDRPKQTENRQKSQSAVPQAEVPGIQSSQSKIETKQVATDHLQALDDTPAPELLEELRAAQRELLELWIFKFETEGFPRTVVLEEVIEVINSHFPELSESTQPTQNTTGTGLAQVGATERHPDLENRPSAPTSNNMRESQHGSKSPRDAIDGMLYNGEATSRLSTPLPGNKKRSTTTRLKLTGLTSVRISNEQEFLEVFQEYGLDKITVGEYVINLLELARQTVEDVKPTFQERQRELEEQERQQEHQRRRGRTLAHREKRKVPTGPVNITDDVWQVLFTIIANMFVFGPRPLYDTFKAMSQEFSTGSNEHARRNRGSSNNAGAGPLSERILFEILHKKQDLEKLIQSVRWLRAKENKFQAQLEKVYVYYKKLETVRLYDDLKTSWEEHEEAIRNFERETDGQHQDAATCILDCIWQQIRPSCEEDTNNISTPLPKDSEELKFLSKLISEFRPICSLVDVFGKGVLLLLTDRDGDYVLGMVGEGQEHYPQHERIHDVAQSLHKVDRRRHNGRLSRQFTALEEKVLRPITQRFEGVDAGSLEYHCPTTYHLNKFGVGQRISHLLNCISGSANTGSNIMTNQGTTTQGRQRQSKRTISHNGTEEAADGEQGTSKRQRTESGEDEESRQEGPGGNNDPEEDIYNA